MRINGDPLGGTVLIYLSYANYPNNAALAAITLQSARFERLNIIEKKHVTTKSKH